MIKPNWMNNDIEKDNYLDIIKKVTESINGKEEKVIDTLIDHIHLDEKSKEKIQ
jgi:hypothetical protein